MGNRLHAYNDLGHSPPRAAVLSDSPSPLTRLFWAVSEFPRGLLSIVRDVWIGRVAPSTLMAVAAVLLLALLFYFREPIMELLPFFTDPDITLMQDTSPVKRDLDRIWGLGSPN